MEILFLLWWFVVPLLPMISFVIICIWLGITWND